MILGGPGGDVSVAKLRRVVQPSAYRTGLGLGRSDALSGANVSRDDAMGLPPFWSGVMLLAKTAGTLPLEVRDEGNANQVVRGGDLARRLRVQANGDTPASVFWTTLFAHLIPTHNAYALKLPANDGLAAAPELFLLEPELVDKYRDERGVVRFDVYTREGAEFAKGVHHRHVIHFRGPSVHSTFRPDSMISVARHALGNALATQEYQGAMYRNGGVPRGILSVDEPLTLEQGIEMADAWRAAYGGMENYGKIAVLDRGGKYQSVAMQNDSAQFVEQMQMSATDAARLLNIPPAFIGAEGSAMTYDNASSNNIHFLTYALRPWLDLVEGALNMDADLFGMRSPWVPRFNTDEITRPDQSERYANYAAAIAAGWMGVDEPREAEGLPPRKVEPVAPVEPVEDAVGGGMDAANRSEAGGELRIVVGEHGRAELEAMERRAEQDRAQRSEDAAALVAALSGMVERMVERPAPEPPVVNVEVSPAEAPVVNVAAPNVTVRPDIRVEVPRAESGGETKTVKFQRNAAGNVIGATIEEQE